MNPPRINRIEVPWHQFFKRVEGLQTAPRDDPLVNEIVVLPEIIPIIFVPGIMGTRLKNASGKKAWDPDSGWFMLSRYGIVYTAPEKRKERLIGKQSHSVEYLHVDEVNQERPVDKKGLGWDGVAWNFYGGILQALAEHQWPQPLDLCFKFPVYAFGYNWSASNHDSGKALARKIEETIEQNNTWTPWQQVILVTHSMGGLVARSACKLHGAEDKVLGVVHGTQPATGAPAAYQRMKHGFRDLNRTVWNWFASPLQSIGNKVSEHVLGGSGPSVTMVMANMPGGLELLPNHLYKTNNGSSRWLTFNLANGMQVRLPEKDVDREVYAAWHETFRLVDPAWLGGGSGAKDRLDAQEEFSPWDNYKTNLRRAKAFHNDLGNYPHPETYQFYSTGINSADRVIIKGQKYLARDLAQMVHQHGKQFFEILDETGNIVDPHALWEAHLPSMYDGVILSCRTNEMLYAYAIEPPQAMGDGTVPDGSGSALNARPQSDTKGPYGTVDINENEESEAKREHSRIFSSAVAKKITLTAIENICKHKFRKETCW